MYGTASNHVKYRALHHSTLQIHPRFEFNITHWHWERGLEFDINYIGSSPPNDSQANDIMLEWDAQPTQDLAGKIEAPFVK